jgi:hypothetical protein
MDQQTTDPVQTAAVIVSRRGAHGNAYRPEYCDQIREFFSSAARTRNVTVTELRNVNYVSTGPGTSRMTTGSKRDEVRRICGELPTFAGFAHSRGFTARTIRNWRAKYPDFDAACVFCEEVQKEFLTQGLLDGSVPPVGGIFVAKNVTAYHDQPMVERVEHGVTNVPEGVEGERPPLAERTPEELARLRQLVEQARKLGAKVTV